ncbi:MAG: hypothetical protein EOP84_28420, partial [Verrucomicrobiaceae bacterium]
MSQVTKVMSWPGFAWARVFLVPALVRHWDWFLLLSTVYLGFRRLMQYLPEIWFSSDTYYAHGVFVPICAGLVIADRWPKLKDQPLDGNWWALLLLTPVFYVEWMAVRTSLYDLQSCLFLLTLAGGILWIAGGVWL